MNAQMGACGGGGRGAAERQQTAVRRHAMVTERNEGNGGIAGIEPRLGTISTLKTHTHLPMNAIQMDIWMSAHPSH